MQRLLNSRRHVFKIETIDQSHNVSNPKAQHDTVVKIISKHLLGTSDEGLMHTTNEDKGFEEFLDANLFGGFSMNNAKDLASVHSRPGFAIKHASCPIAWSSKLQSEIALSTTEAEHISLSQSLRDLIPLHNIFDELGEVEFIEKDKRITKTYSTVYEDNRGALELAREPKFRPRTKHVATKYHHFRNAVAKGRIKIFSIDTKEQQADIFTKPLPKPQFEKLRKLIMGW